MRADFDTNSAPVANLLACPLSSGSRDIYNSWVICVLEPATVSDRGELQLHKEGRTGKLLGRLAKVTLLL